MARQSVMPAAMPRRSRLPIQSRYSGVCRTSRIGRTSAEPEDEFLIRKPLSKYIREEMQKTGRTMFFQRVFILAKNADINKTMQPKFRDEDGAVGQDKRGREKKKVQVSSTRRSLSLSSSVRRVSLRDSLKPRKKTKKKVDVDTDEPKASENAPKDDETAPKEVRKKDGELKERKIFFFGGKTKPRRSGEASEDDEKEGEDDEEEDEEDEPIKLDFKTNFEDRLEQAHEHCMKLSLTHEKITGLLLVMGDYTLLILESAEDTVGDYLSDLAQDTETWWAQSRVFCVEDNIGETYFKDFVVRRSFAVSTTEKLPPNVQNDFGAMATEHIRIREKLQVLCEKIAQGIRDEEEAIAAAFNAAAAAASVIVHKTRHSVDANSMRKPSTGSVLPSEAELETQSAPEDPLSETVKQEGGAVEGEVNTEMETETEMGTEAETEADTAVETETEKEAEVEGDRAVGEESDAAMVVPPPSEVGRTSSYIEEITLSETVLRVSNFVRPEKTDSFVVPEVPEDEAVSMGQRATLQPEVFNRFLPEVQWIDAILLCDRFYFDLTTYASMYGEIPLQMDEDDMMWPIANNYTPKGIFDAFPYNVNFSFGDYLREAKKRRRRSMRQTLDNEDDEDDEDVANPDGAAENEEA